jgi:5-methylthioadenosine/S-adenosylhomocysteine deaminase
MKKSRKIIKGAHIVSMDDRVGDLSRGDILISEGKIERIGETTNDTDAEVIDGLNKIAIPGLIDAHNCVWQTTVRGIVPNIWTDDYNDMLMPLRAQFVDEDNRDAGYVGAAEMLSYGTTTVVDYCHNIATPGMADAAIQGLQEAGIRHVFTYSFLGFRGERFESIQARLEDGARVFQEFHRPGTLTTVNFGIQSVGADTIPMQLDFARSRGVKSCIHINRLNEILWLGKEGLLGPDLLAVHGNLITNPELELMAKVGMPVCFTIPVDVQGTPADVVMRALQRNVPVVFGCDVASHVASDLLHQLRVMFYVQGFLDGARERAFNTVTSRRPGPGEGLPLLKPRDLLRMATIESAKVLGLEDEIGSLTPGKKADVVLVDRGMFGNSIAEDPCAHILLQTSARDVSEVLVDGELLVRNGALIHFDVARVSSMRRGAERVLGCA